MNRSLILILISLLSAACLASVATAQSPRQTIPSIIFDSDMGPDYDDVGAIALLHALADSGECRILATIASDKHKWVAAAFDVFNTYFNRPDIPIGIATGNAVNIPAPQKWDSFVVANYPHDLKNNEMAESAVQLYRRILAAQPDESVTIVTVGFLTNLSRLLKSPPDQYSGLNGERLVRKKVKRLVSMAACFDHRMGELKEFNVKMDAEAALYAFGHWPTPIVFSGFEIGVKILTGLPIIANNAIKNSPVKDVFVMSIPADPQDKNGRMSWDETAVLVAVRDPTLYFDIVKGKYISKEDGSNSWDPSGSKHAYLKHKFPPEQIAKVIDQLIMHQPKK